MIPAAGLVRAEALGAWLAEQHGQADGLCPMIPKPRPRQPVARRAEGLCALVAHGCADRICGRRVDLRRMQVTAPRKTARAASAPARGTAGG